MDTVVPLVNTLVKVTLPVNFMKDLFHYPFMLAFCRADKSVVRNTQFFPEFLEPGYILSANSFGERFKEAAAAAIF